MKYVYILIGILLVSSCSGLFRADKVLYAGSVGVNKVSVCVDSVNQFKLNEEK